MSNNTFISTTDRETDNNYNPQAQFVTDNRRRIEKYLNKIIYESTKKVRKRFLIEQIEQKVNIIDRKVDRISRKKMQSLH
jgi:hypothetical protein